MTALESREIRDTLVKYARRYWSGKHLWYVILEPDWHCAGQAFLFLISVQRVEKRKGGTVINEKEEFMEKKGGGAIGTAVISRGILGEEVKSYAN